MVIVPQVTRPEPFLRWAGGKRRLLSVLHDFLPKNMEVGSFFEPFVGGGAVMFSLHESHANQSRIVINDINTDLTVTYVALRDDFDAVHGILKGLADKNTEDDYYRIRAQSPASTAERAARLIYLNRTGFNGLYRVNGRGEFNVPYGKLKNPNICNSPLLLSVHRWLQRVEIMNTSFGEAVAEAKENDTVYFDPPYIPVSLTSSFSKYAKDDFLLDDQRKLAKTIEELTARGVRVILSNSFTPLTLEVFGDVLRMKIVTVTRSISAKTESRGTIQEVIGFNFPTRAMKNPKAVNALPDAR